MDNQNHGLLAQYLTISSIQRQGNVISQEVKEIKEKICFGRNPDPLIMTKKYCEPYVLGIIFCFNNCNSQIKKKKWYASVNHSDAYAAGNKYNIRPNVK